MISLSICFDTLAVYIKNLKSFESFGWLIRKGAKCHIPLIWKLAYQDWFELLGWARLCYCLTPYHGLNY